MLLGQTKLRRAGVRIATKLRRAGVRIATRPGAGVKGQECGVEAEGETQGWEAYPVDLDGDGQDEVVFYCAVCAERD